MKWITLAIGLKFSKRLPVKRFNGEIGLLEMVRSSPSVIEEAKKMGYKEGYHHGMDIPIWPMRELKNIKIDLDKVPPRFWIISEV